MSSAIRPTCPGCGSIPTGGPLSWTCAGCGATYRGLRGIVDLRTFDDPFLANRRDWEYAERLDDDFDRLDFRGLLDRYFDLSPEIPSALRKRQVSHILTAPGRVRAWLEALGPASDRGPLLDLGCGSGSFLSAVGPSGRPLAGVDIALRWLIVARKRLDEEGLGHIPLACGCAERLPFADESFAGVVAGDVIEHVADQDATLVEAHRVLRPGGRLFLASPNRYSLAPEPHVQVWGVGFLPRAWMAAYVRAVSGRDFRAIRTLGSGEWGWKLRRSRFSRWTVDVPALPPDDLAEFGPLKRRVGLAYNRAVATRFGRAAGLAFGPMFHVVCERAEAARATSPATRPTTRRPATPS